MIENKEDYWCINNGCGGDRCKPQCDFCKIDDEEYQKTGKSLGSFSFKGTIDDKGRFEDETTQFLNNLASDND